MEKNGANIGEGIIWWGHGMLLIFAGTRPTDNSGELGGIVPK